MLRRPRRTCLRPVHRGDPAAPTEHRSTKTRGPAPALPARSPVRLSRLAEFRRSAPGFDSPSTNPAVREVRRHPHTLGRHAGRPRPPPRSAGVAGSAHTPFGDEGFGRALKRRAAARPAPTRCRRPKCPAKVDRYAQALRARRDNLFKGRGGGGFL